MKINYSNKDTFNLFQHTAFGINLATWFRVLMQNKWNVHPIYWPKVLVITFIALFSFPVQLLERIVFSKRIKHTKITQPVFILGYFRSGTTYLLYVLGADPKFVAPTTYQVLTPHLFLLFGKGIRKMFDSVMPATRPQDNVKITAKSPSEEEFALANMSPHSLVNGYVFPKRISQTFSEIINNQKAKNEWKRKFDYFLRKVMVKNQSNIPLLKSPLNTARIEEIVSLYPDAKFIHIHRNPYDVYVSNERLLEKILPKTALNRPKEEDLEQFIMDSYQETYKLYLQSKSNLKSNQLVEIAYAEFEKNPIEVLKSVYEKIELGDFEPVHEFLENEISSTKSYKKNEYNNLSQKRIETINKEWGFMFDEYGYEMIKVFK